MVIYCWCGCGHDSHGMRPTAHGLVQKCHPLRSMNGQMTMVLHSHSTSSIAIEADDGGGEDAAVVVAAVVAAAHAIAVHSADDAAAVVVVDDVANNDD